MLRADWKLWTVGVIAAPALAVVAWYTDSRFLSLVAAAAVGFILSALLAGWIIGGHASSLPWLWGAQGEQYTAEEVAKLGPAWHCEHDIEHAHGNWDHVLVGPPGIFLLDSKALHNAATASSDALRSGRIAYRGGTMRSGALAIRRALERRFRHIPWVQGVFVVWAEFPQKRHEEDRVFYVQGHELVPWLLEQPPRLDAPHRAAIIAALHEERGAIAAAGYRWRTRRS